LTSFDPTLHAVAGVDVECTGILPGLDSVPAVEIAIALSMAGYAFGSP